MAGQTTIRHKTAAAMLGIMVPAGLYLTSRQNYLLFHSLVELFSVVVACAVFVIAWNARRFLANNYLLFIGIASLFVALVDLLHTLAYKNMGVFPGSGANLPTQLWIAARYLQSVSLLIAPLFLHRTFRPAFMLAGYAAVVLLLLASVFSGHFPTCFVEGVGLTPFKKGSEYLISFILLAALLFLQREREAFDRRVLRFMTGTIILLVVAELSFTLYVDVYGIANMAGHLFKVGGFLLIYRALVETGLARPYDLLFRELKQSEERYRFLYEHTPVMLHSIDQAGNLLNVSNYWLEQLGYTRDEVLGRKTVAFMTEESRRYALKVILPVYYRTGSLQDVPYRLVKKNGEMMDVLLSAVAERNEAGEITRSLTVMVDVTERRRAEKEIESLNADLLNRNDELEESNCELEAALQDLESSNQELERVNRELEGANRELDAFNSSVSHDLRRPLTNISGFSQIILELYGTRLDEQCREFVAGIHRETKRMDQLIDTLLKFARLSRSPLTHEAVDLSSMAQGVALELAATEPGRRVAVSVVPGLVAEGDGRLLRIALQNLIGNAWKYTRSREGAEIEVGRCEKEGVQAFFVRDNGIGFDPAEAGQLFTPFQRLSTAADFEGTGIGLATVQRIIDRHKGRIWAEGRPGQGATFYFTLPEEARAGGQE